MKSRARMNDSMAGSPLAPSMASGGATSGDSATPKRRLRKSQSRSNLP